MLYRVHLSWAAFELTTLDVIGTGCIGSCKSNSMRSQSRWSHISWQRMLSFCKSETIISQLSPCFSPEEDYIGNRCAMLQLILEHVVSEKIFKSSSQIIWNCAWLSCFVAEWNEDWFLKFDATFVAISFIGWGNRSTRKQPQTCRKLLTNVIT
jgi:hypothetical protein